MVPKHLPMKSTKKLRPPTLKQLWFALLALLGAGAGFEGTNLTEATPPTDQPAVQVRFSPKGGCTALVVKAIEQAEEKVYVMAYGFTSKEVADALLRAARRGIQVWVIVDDGEYQRQTASQVDRLRGMSNIRLQVDPRSGYAHDKMILIDPTQPNHCGIVIGSFNFDTRAETRNYENLLYITNAPTHAQTCLNRYQYEWQKVEQGQARRK